MANLSPDWKWWAAAQASVASSSGVRQEKRSIWSPSESGDEDGQRSPGSHLHVHTHRVRSSLLPAEKTKRSKWLDSPRATAATVKRTNRFLLRKPLTLLLLMELILSFMLLAFFSITRCSRLLKSPFSGEGGLSTSSFRKRLVLAGGFSFIINSSTWSRRQVSWETRSGEDNREREDLSRL